MLFGATVSRQIIEGQIPFPRLADHHLALDNLGRCHWTVSGLISMHIRCGLKRMQSGV